MASAIIHIAVAKKVNEYLNRNKKELYLGAIAPDAAKIIGIDRKITHFISKNDDDSSPNIEYFKSLYIDKMSYGLKNFYQILL